jgi:nicotinamidase/pyrazinamidase
MPPEQALGRSEAIDARSDVYSLGATLYHMLAGSAPFKADSVFGLMRKIERDDPPPLPPHVPRMVEQIVARMMAKSPGDRYQTYAELIEDLRAAQRSGESPPGASSSMRSSSRFSGSVIIPAARTSGRSIASAAPSENRVLLVVDVQNDFCPGGALAVPGGDELPPIISKLSRRFAHVILTQDWHPEDHLSFASSHPGAKPFSMVDLAYGPQVLWPDHCVQNEEGSEFHPKLKVEHCEMVIRKGYRRERGLSRLFLCGLATDFCVAYSALDARRLGFEVTVIESACRGIDLDGSLEAAWLQMEEAGVVRA